VINGIVLNRISVFLVCSLGQALSSSDVLAR
jgi:hypothetical protein